MPSLQSALGVVAIIAIAFVISQNRRAVPWRPVIIGLILTFALALLMLKIPQAEIVFGWSSEMFIVMTGGMAGIAGTVFVLYATILANAIQNAAGHIAVCSVLGAPAAIVISLLMVPVPNRQHTGGRLDDVKQTASGTMDATVQGTGAGLELLLNIVAMLIVFVALVYLANAVLGLLPDFLGGPVTLQRALGWVMAPVCWLMGIPWSQVVTAGGLMGIKTVLNELVAYLQLAALPDGTLDPRSRAIMLYAMCGFANFGSLGIMIAALRPCARRSATKSSRSASNQSCRAR